MTHAGSPSPSAPLASAAWLGRARKGQFAVGLVSRAGSRPVNQDVVAWHEGDDIQKVTHGAVALLADGMGGAKAGGLAAKLACESFIDAYFGQSPTLGVALAAAEGTSSFGTSGYIIEASGYTRQWGHYTTPVGGNATVTITFPVAFATACLGASATIDNTGHASSTSTGIVVYTAPSTTTVTFQTVGYQSGSINNVAGFYWEVFGH